MRHDVVELHLLIEIEPARIGLPAIQMPGQLHHVVAVARLARRLGDATGQLIGLAEMLALGIAADDVAVMLRHPLVEEARGDHMRRVARHLVQPCQADHLRYLRIGMQARQPVLPRGEGIEHRLVPDLLGHAQPARIAGQGIGFRISLVQPAMLGVQHLLHLRVVERLQHAGQIACQSQHDRHRPRIARQHMCVDQPGMDLVPRIERHPSAVQVEPPRADVAAPYLLEHDLAVDRLAVALHRGAAAIAVAVRSLDTRHFGQRMIQPRRHLTIARIPHHQRACGQPVAQRVAGNAHRLPAAIDRLGCRQAGRLVEIVQQPLGIEGQQIAAVRLERVGKGRRLQPHITRRHWLDPAAAHDGQLRPRRRRQCHDAGAGQQGTTGKQHRQNLSMARCPHRASALLGRAAALKERVRKCQSIARWSWRSPPRRRGSPNRRSRQSYAPSAQGRLYILDLPRETSTRHCGDKLHRKSSPSPSMHPPTGRNARSRAR